jgi:uncharacterized membrane protein YjjP (DUF1212 family)
MTTNKNINKVKKIREIMIKINHEHTYLTNWMICLKFYINLKTILAYSTYLILLSYFILSSLICL